jgi:hypothetical protein
MKTASSIATFILFLSCLSVQAVSGEEQTWKLQVDLIDGSRIVGKPSNKALKIDIEFDEMEIPLERIRRADRQKDGQTFRVEFKNNDVLSGKVTPEPVIMTTLFGEVTLSMNHIKALTVIPRNPYGWLPIQKGLVAYYNFDRLSKEHVDNAAADIHDGVISDASWTELGSRGGGMKFSGKAKITIPHHEDLCPSRLTVSAWICPQGTRGSYATLISKSEYSWSGGYGFVCMAGDPKNVYFYVNGYTTSTVKAETPTGEWTHLVGVCDGEVLKIYRNGHAIESVQLKQVAAEETNETQQTPSLIRHTKTPLFIGSGHSKYAWSGKIDEVALYDRPLTPQEIKLLFESGKAHERHVRK